MTGFQRGDEVMGISEGSFAELAIARPDKLVPKPANLTFEQAAAVPISGITALRAVRDVGNVQPGQKVLIVGAAGGVGSLAVQIAKASGAEVTGVCSTSKEELVRSIGAEDLVAVAELIDAGRVTPVIDRTYPLIEAPDAIRYLEEGHTRGKVVVSIPQTR